MKNRTLLLFALLLVGILSCKNDDDNPVDCSLPDVEVGFKNYEVDFYSTHKNFVVQPVIFETVTEQVLIKPAHLEGAFFETVTEQYLDKESYKRYQILDSMIIHLVANSETDSIAKIACYNFFEEVNFVEQEIPAEYRTLIKQIIAQQGTGAEIPAVYSTITSRRVMTNAQIIPITDDQQFNRVEFRIPDDQTIREYLANQFGQQMILDCEEGNSYKIHE
ncbi:MAG: hypothetical protein AB8F94_07950 [Saprospiraceae bacterium]